MRYMFSILAILCFLSGCFGKTPEGTPAYHQLGISALCLALAIAFWQEHLKIKKDLDDMGV